MLTDKEFDSSKYKLGTLCGRKHQFDGCDRSLRYLTDNSCVQCRAYRGKTYKHPVRTEGLIDGKYYLGALCKENHNYQGTGQTLRGVNTRQCVECRTSYEKAWRPPGQEVGDIYILGSICKRNHRYEGKALTLRYANSGACVECSITEHKKKRDIKAEKRIEARLADLSYCDSLLAEAGLNTDRFTLSKLCPRNHDWNQTGKSLRYINSTKCRQCQLDIKAKKYQKHILSSAYILRRLSKTESKISCNRQSISGRRVKSKQKALKLGNYHFPYKNWQWFQRLEDFNNSCAYCCKQTESLTIDHFLPLDYGGTDTFQNVVPCCNECNTSKNNKDPYEWFAGKSFFTRDRWKFILNALGKTQNNYLQLTLF